MSKTIAPVEKCIQLSTDRAERLSQLAKIQEISEDRIVEKALDILFSLAEPLDESATREGWALLSEATLARIWDNDEDSQYDNWQELYDISKR